MKKLLLLSAVAVCAGLVWSASVPVDAQQGQQQALVIQGGTLIDGNGGAPVPNSVIVVQGNRITAVGRQGQVQVPAGAQVVNAAGKWVLPGLFDAKANWNWQYGEGFLHYGVTSAIVSGGRNNLGSAVRDAINHGVFPGPRLYQALVTIGGPGPNRDRNDNYTPGAGTRIPRTGEDAVAHVRAMHEAGADIITFQNGDGPPDVFAPAVAEAQRLGLGIDFRAMGPQTRALQVCQMGSGIVYVHTGNVGAQIARDESKWATYIALPPDAYSEMDMAKADAAIRQLVACNAYLEPDLMATARGFHKNWARVKQEARSVFTDPQMLAYYPEHAILDLYENVQMPEEYLTPQVIAVRKAGFANQMTFLKRFVDAGGKLVAASDITQSPPGLGVHQEITAFVEDVGLTPMQAILAGTSNVADGFRIEDVGRIQQGKLADILIVNANPLTDIHNLRNIDTVIKDGKVLQRGYTSWFAGHMFELRETDDDPIVGGAQWMNALKAATGGRGGGGGGAAGGGGRGGNQAAAAPEPPPNPTASPTPGIESFAPHTVLRGTGDTVVTITGFNFVRGSRVYYDDFAVPTQVVSRTQIRATIPANLLGRAGKFELRVKNPEPIATLDWGDTSNPGYLLVPFEYTKLLPQPRW
jgi:imidazolonepropionase-like amidohydrolase